MNQPPYNLYTVMGDVVEKTRAALELSELHYDFDTIEKLNGKLAVYSESPEFASIKFPLVWLARGFRMKSGNGAYYAEAKGLKVFVINESTVNASAAERIQNNFVPVIWPIYWELLAQMNTHEAIVSEVYRDHYFSDHFNLGEGQQSVYNDVIDCLSIEELTLKLQHNRNCQPNFKSF